MSSKGGQAVPSGGGASVSLHESLGARASSAAEDRAVYLARAGVHTAPPAIMDVSQEVASIIRSMGNTLETHTIKPTPRPPLLGGESQWRIH